MKKNTKKEYLFPKNHFLSIPIFNYLSKALLKQKELEDQAAFIRSFYRINPSFFMPRIKTNKEGIKIATLPIQAAGLAAATPA